MASHVNRRHPFPFRTLGKIFQASNFNLPGSRLRKLKCFGLIKQVWICKKVLIEFLTKFILDNVWKRQKSFWICRQFEQVDDNQITDSQSHLIQGARLLKEHWKIILYSKDITNKYTSHVSIVKGTAVKGIRYFDSFNKFIPMHNV